jgi:hypothetical protein
MIPARGKVAGLDIRGVFQSLLHKMVDLAERMAGITFAKVIAPAFQMGIDLCDQHRDWHEAFIRAGRFPQFVPFTLQRLFRHTQIQVVPIAAKGGRDRTCMCSRRCSVTASSITLHSSFCI